MFPQKTVIISFQLPFLLKTWLKVLDCRCTRDFEDFLTQYIFSTVNELISVVHYAQFFMRFLIDFS